MSHNKLSDLSGLETCERLESLALDSTGLTELPPGLFTRLQHLKYLSARWNSLTALPDTICTLPRIEQLCFTYTRISSLPQGLAHLAPTLLVISCLSLLDPCREDGTAKPNKHQNNVTVADNALQDVPPGIFQLPRVQILRLSNNQITELRHDMSGLTNVGIFSSLPSLTPRFAKFALTALM